MYENYIFLTIKFGSCYYNKMSASIVLNSGKGFDAADSVCIIIVILCSSFHDLENSLFLITIRVQLCWNRSNVELVFIITRLKL